MESTLARRFTYSSHLIDGNVITDLMSIGAKTDLTGPAPPPPANPGGLNLHGFIEGDASFTRGALWIIYFHCKANGYLMFR